MVGNTTILKDPDGKQEDKKFTFDYSYWSHDGYEEQDNGYYAPVDPQYADQRKLFDDLGRGVLANAWEGFNCSLFAYGQTGSGKSYSIFGYKGNKGMVPTICAQLFEEIAQSSCMIKVTVSMVEIYNEKVKDLLGNKSDLKVRESQKVGFFLADLTTELVADYEAMQFYIEKGNSHRTIKKTQMNNTSSRAHTIFRITLNQIYEGEDGKMKKTSVINLIDLAGSERVGRNNVQGNTFNEGTNINLSLLTLGNCINSIEKNEKPPFRNSVMTKLLKNALSGNSKTIMLAALSPSDSDYTDTLSTLQFADRAKNIKTEAEVNEDPYKKLIRELREEVAKLKDQLKNAQRGPATSVANQLPSPYATTENIVQYVKDIQKNEEQISKLEEELNSTSDELESKKKELENIIKNDLLEIQAKKKRRKRNPHIWNLHSDKMLSGVLAHFTPPGETTLGSSTESNISLKGIQSEHAVITNEENEHIFISPVSEEATVRVNGIRVTEKTTLAHHDRIFFGSFDLYVLEHPYELAKLKEHNIKPPLLSFELARDEIFSHCSYGELSDHYPNFLEGYNEDEYKQIKKHFKEKQKEEIELLKTNHEKKLKVVCAKYEKWWEDEVGKFVEWNGKLVSLTEKENAEKLKALEEENHRLQKDRNSSQNTIAAKEKEIKDLKFLMKIQKRANQRELEAKKEFFNKKIENILDEFERDIKMKDFQQERSRILRNVEQLEQVDKEMQNIKKESINAAQKSEAVLLTNYFMNTLKQLKLLLEKQEQDNSTRNAILLVECENQYQILQQIQKKRNQEKNPHFWNLNEEPDLSKVILHMVMPGQSNIGSGEEVKIKMSGPGILENHALVENDGQDVYIQPLADNIQILVNGKVVRSKQKLQDNDRIYFGPNHLYVFNKPQDGRKKSNQPMITFEAAWTEITSNTSFMINTEIVNNLHGIPSEEVKNMKRDHLIELHRLRQRLKRAKKDLEKKRQEGNTLYVNKTSKVCLVL